MIPLCAVILTFIGKQESIGIELSMTMLLVLTIFVSVTFPISTVYSTSIPFKRLDGGLQDKVLSLFNEMFFTGYRSPNVTIYINFELYLISI